MRKFSIILVCMTLIFGFTGCSENSENKNDEVQEMQQNDISSEEISEELMLTIEKDPDGIYFRKTVWGMTINQVKKSEDSSPDEEDEGYLGYNNLKVSSIDTSASYLFNDDNELYRGIYLITESHVTKNSYIDDYQTLKSGLIEKYGTPTTDEVIWKDDLYKDDPSDYGMSVATGKTVYYAIWEKNDIKVMISLSGDNFDIILGISYEDTIRAKNVTEADNGL